MTTIREHAERLVKSHSTSLEAHHIGKAIIKALEEAEHATMIGDKYGDYCCDCGSPIRLWHPSWETQGWSLGSDDIVGRFVPDPVKP